MNMNDQINLFCIIEACCPLVIYFLFLFRYLNVNIIVLSSYSVRIHQVLVVK